jgi:predicted transcriptional regulator
MTLDEALARVRKLAERRREKAQAYSDAAAEYEARALSADEVLSAVQREFLVSLGVNAQRSAKAMADDAEALEVLLNAGRP